MSYYLYIITALQREPYLLSFVGVCIHEWHVYLLRVCFMSYVDPTTIPCIFCGVHAAISPAVHGIVSIAFHRGARLTRGAQPHWAERDTRGGGFHNLPAVFRGGVFSSGVMEAPQIYRICR